MAGELDPMTLLIKYITLRLVYFLSLGLRLHEFVFQSDFVLELVNFLFLTFILISEKRNMINGIAIDSLLKPFYCLFKQPFFQSCHIYLLLSMLKQSAGLLIVVSYLGAKLLDLSLCVGYLASKLLQFALISPSLLYGFFVFQKNFELFSPFG